MIRRSLIVTNNSLKYVRKFGVQYTPVEGQDHAQPYVQSYRNAWPDEYPAVDRADPILPPRTVPESALRFRMTSRLDLGSAAIYEHLHVHPADLKITMFVSDKDLGLNPLELKIYKRMVGDRYIGGRQETKFTCNYFPNRTENKRYLLVLLENLITEAKRLAAIKEEDYPAIVEDIERRLDE